MDVHFSHPTMPWSEQREMTVLVASSVLGADGIGFSVEHCATTDPGEKQRLL